MSQNQPAENRAALKATVYGRVQGVYYRAFVTRIAVRLQLSGWVRNQPEGSVQLLAEGDKPKLEELLDNLKQGPSGARVDKVDTYWGEYTGLYHGFSITG